MSPGIFIDILIVCILPVSNVKLRPLSSTPSLTNPAILLLGRKANPLTSRRRLRLRVKQTNRLISGHVKDISLPHAETRTFPPATNL